MNKSETKHTCCGGRQNFWLWLGALVVGSCLGLLGVEWVNTMANFVATIFTRLFQFIAVPTIALAVTTTLATFGMQRETRRIFRHTISCCGHGALYHHLARQLADGDGEE